MGEMSIKRVFKQHNSLVVTLPWWFRRWMKVERGDYLVFEQDDEGGQVKVYKWHKGVERSYPDYGRKNIRDRDRAKQA